MPLEGWLGLTRHCILFALLIAAVYTDLTRGKIYNWCTLGGMIAGLLIGYALGGLWDWGVGGPGLGSSLLAMGMVLLAFAWPYMKGGIAAGDVKLMLAVGAICGLRTGAYALFFSSLVGALMVTAIFLWRGRLWDGVKGAVRFTFTLERIGGSKTTGDGQEPTPPITVPYGLAIAVGSVIAWYLVEVPR
jgi:prepilin peptidase CpaA